MPFLRPIYPTSGRLLSRLAAALLGLTILFMAYPPFWSTPYEATPSYLVPDFGVLPLSFVPNAGQTHPAVRFQAHSFGGTIFFTPDEVVLSLPVHNQRSSAHHQRLASLTRRSSSVVRLRFEGADPAPELSGNERLAGIVNYFIGNDPDRWRTKLPTYREIIYRDLYPGINLRYTGTTETSGHPASLKGTYLVAPGADPTRIRWRYEGATRIGVDDGTGDLLIELPLQSPIPSLPSQIIERAPLAWQDVDGRRVPVNVRYAIAVDGSIGFVLGAYNLAYPLTIDPTLSYSTYLGGSGHDFVRAIAVDDEGSAYVVGQTSSTDFPTQNPLQPDIGGGPLGDAFVAKLNPSGSGLVYATYLGGSHNDSGYGIAVDSEGHAYVTGDTLSADFPTMNAAQPVSGGGGPFEGDAFVVKLDSSGSALVYSTYLGGGGDELSYGVALDTLGNAYVAGYTSSTNFPVKNAPQPDPAFGQGLNVYGDAFVTQVITASGVYTWGYSTYLGGTDLDIGRDIAVDASGVAYITGQTHSTDFPTEKPPQPGLGGGPGSGRGDAFVTQVISASGVYTWGYSTYLGGSRDDTAYGIGVDSAGDAYVTGGTVSTDFPRANPFQDSYGGDQDAFVTKIVGVGQGYGWGYSTYLGGSGTDLGMDIVVDENDRAYLTGYSFSPDFPTSDDAYDSSCGTDGLCDSAGGDVFFTVLNEAGETLAYSTFLGGSSTDFGYGIAMDAPGDVYLTGITYSRDFPTTTGAYDRTCGADGQCNGFVTDGIMAKFSMAPDLWLSKSADPPANESLTQGEMITYTLVAANKGSTATNVLITDLIPPGTAYVPGSVTSTSGTRTFDGTQVTVSLSSFAASATLTATFQVTVTTSLTTSITNQALLTGDGIQPLDSNPVAHPVQGVGDKHTVYLPTVLKGLDAQPPAGCAPYLVATISVGDTPRGVAVDNNRNRIYVANYESDSLSVIDGNTNTVVQTVTGITSANGVAYDPTHSLIWVTNYDSDQVTPVDADSLTPLPWVAVRDGPWGVAYDPVHDYVYVVNNQDDSVSVIDAMTREVTATLDSAFNKPFHVAVNPVTGKGYVTNFGDHSVTVLDGASVSSVVDLSVSDPSTQPYGVAVDEIRDLVYVATVDSHRVVVIGTLMGTPDRLLGWSAFHRGFGDPARPVPMRVIAVNPSIGPVGDGGHVWTTTSTVYGSEANQALLIPKGWSGYFDYPLPREVGADPSEGIAVDRTTNRVYVSSGTSPGTVTVLGDDTDTCLIPFVAEDGIGFEVFTVE